MNIKIVFYVLGGLLRLLGIIMVVPLGVAYYYGEDLTPFLVSIAITVITGLILLSYKTDEEWMRKEGFAIVGLGWLIAAVLEQSLLCLTGFPPRLTPFLNPCQPLPPQARQSSRI